ncbi:hypothetical protein [Nitrosomonas europaea]|nr:hypothetical protein [Nitrosomonas europaea]
MASQWGEEKANQWLPVMVKVADKIKPAGIFPAKKKYHRPISTDRMGQES